MASASACSILIRISAKLRNLIAGEACMSWATSTWASTICGIWSSFSFGCAKFFENERFVFLSKDTSILQCHREETISKQVSQLRIVDVAISFNCKTEIASLIARNDILIFFESCRGRSIIWWEDHTKDRRPARKRASRDDRIRDRGFRPRRRSRTRDHAHSGHDPLGSSGRDRL